MTQTALMSDPVTATQLLALLEQSILPLYEQGSRGQAQAPKLVLAYSGGVDSEVLAFGLSAFAQKYPHIACLLIHVHHGLSPNANMWVEHCIGRATHYQLPVQIERVNVNKGPRESLEAKARDARYEAFARYLNPADILLTAHHQDDQLETLLLALKRGQGPKGLGAMAPLQVYKQSWLLRPLLTISRQQIEQFAAQYRLSHIEDESNQDDSYDRNFLRLEIIPRLKQRWPSIATTASRSAALCAEQQQVIEDEVSHRLPQWLALPGDTAGLITEPTGFKLAQLSQISPAWQALLFRGYLQHCCVSLPSQSQLQQILTQLLEAKEDAKVTIQWGDYQVKRFANVAYALSNLALAPVEAGRLQSDIRAVLAGELNQASGNIGQQSFSVQIQTQDLTQQDGSAVIPRLALPLEQLVTVKFGAAGSIKCLPQFATSQRSKPRELKKLWQECQVPPWRRQQIPLIFYGDVLVAAIGLWIDKRYLAAPGQPGLSMPLLTFGEAH
jgi:tRNA(Ile)-lysidine synthase